MTIDYYTPPTPEELRSLLRAWHLTQTDAGRLLDKKGRIMRYYVNGAHPLPFPDLYTLTHRVTNRQIKRHNWRRTLAKDLPGDQPK